MKKWMVALNTHLNGMFTMNKKNDPELFVLLILYGIDSCC